MRFTVSFQSLEDRDFSYGLVFVPSPVWVQGSRQVLNLMPENPHYTRGGVARLLAAERIDQSQLGAKHCVVIAHPDGHASLNDLLELLGDLESRGFPTTLLQLPKNQSNR